MNKQTLQFTSLRQLALFAQQLQCGYVMKTETLTLTAPFSETDLSLATQQFDATIMQPTEAFQNYILS